MKSLGYWTHFHAQLAEAVAKGLMKPGNLGLIMNVETVSEVLPALDTYSVPYVDKWLDLDHT